MSNATISKYMAWVRAAVKDNARLRKDRKAFIETQNELVSEIQVLRAELEAQIARRNRAVASLRSAEALLEAQGMPTYWDEITKRSIDAHAAIMDFRRGRISPGMAMHRICDAMDQAAKAHLKNTYNPLESGPCENSEVPK